MMQETLINLSGHIGHDLAVSRSHLQRGLTSVVKVSRVSNHAVSLNYNALVSGVMRGSNRISVELVEIGLIVSNSGLIF